MNNYVSYVQEQVALFPLEAIFPTVYFALVIVFIMAGFSTPRPKCRKTRQGKLKLAETAMGRIQNTLLPPSQENRRS